MLNLIPHRSNSYNERHKDDTTLFVFHTINTKTDKPTGWNYNPLPAGWNWIGASGQSEGGYTREEQLMGPKKSKAAALKQITKVLTKLKADGILTKFKVRQSYKPGTTKTKKGRKSPAESASQFEEGTVRPVRIYNPHEPPTDTDFNRLIPPQSGGIMLN